MGLARACGRATCQWGAEEKACWCLEDRGECDRFLQGSLPTSRSLGLQVK